MPVQACGANLFPSSTHFEGDHAPPPPSEIEGRAALIHEHDALSGIDLEVLSVSARAGARGAGAEAVLERVGVTVGRAEIQGELLALGVELGTRNADGSKGLGIGTGAVIAGIEAGVNLGSDTTLTLGASAGIGLHLSVGLRDADHDGKPALCARVVEWFTLAGCIELPW
jgi:hypothetical protein